MEDRRSNTTDSRPLELRRGEDSSLYLGRIITHLVQSAERGGNQQAIERLLVAKNILNHKRGA